MQEEYYRQSHVRARYLYTYLKDRADRLETELVPTRQEFIHWLDRNDYEDIHETWATGGYKRKDSPSIRINDENQPITLDNLTLTTTNTRSYTIPRTSKPVAAYKDGKLVNVYVSIADAARRVERVRATLIVALKKPRLTSAGFTWLRVHRNMVKLKLGCGHQMIPIYKDPYDTLDHTGLPNIFIAPLVKKSRIVLKGYHNYSQDGSFEMTHIKDLDAIADDARNRQSPGELT